MADGRNDWIQPIRAQGCPPIRSVCFHVRLKTDGSVGC